MKIELMDIDCLKPYDHNPRLNDDAVDAVAASIQEFGWKVPLVVDGDGVIICGHTRWKAAKRLQLAKVPVHVATDLTPEQVKAYRIADNKTGELAEWDFDQLRIEIADLQGADFDLDVLAFDDDELTRLLGGDNEVVTDGQTDPDSVPEPPDEAVSVRGAIYQLGDHRLMCGDSADPGDLDKLLAGQPIHLANTDPPYNVKVEPRSNNAIAAGLSSFTQTHHQKLDVERHPEKAHATHTQLRPKDRPLENDFVTDEEFDRLLDAWFGNIARVLLPGHGFYIWGGYANCGNYPPFLKKHKLYFSQAVIWDKQHPVLTRKDFMGAHEWCFYGWKEGAAHRFFGPNNATDLWHIKKVNPQSMIHLCLHPDTLVLTEAGYRPISSIQAGARVFSGDGSFHRVTNVSSHAYTSDHLYRITAKGGNVSTDASDNHPFLIWRPERRGRRIVGGKVDWVRADKLQSGDYTMTPVLSDCGPDPFPELDEEDWFLFGLWLAQGHLQAAGHGENRYPVFSIHKKRQDLAERIWRKWGRASEYDPNDYADEPSSGMVVMAFDAEAGARFEALGGRHAHGKRIAPVCFRLPHAKRKAILQGWLNGDGCMVHDRSYWQGNTVSADLAAHLGLLAESVGYRTTVYAYDPPTELGGIGDRPFKSRRRVYCLYFYERKQLAKRGSPTWMEHEGRLYSLRYIKSVEPVSYTGEVWNLSVEGHPSFQTAVGLSHNTEKPVALALQAIQFSSKRGENVLDLFGGSGSTLMGCEQTGRRGFLMEIDPLYCDVIRKRWAEFVHGEGCDWQALTPAVDGSATRTELQETEAAR